MNHQSLPNIIIEHSNKYDDLEYIYNDHCFFQNLIWDKKRNETLIFYAIKNNNIILFDFLIEKKCNVNHINTHLSTPLQCAIINQHPYFVKKLILNGANIHYKNKHNIGPLTFLNINKYPKYDLRNNKQKEIKQIINTFINIIYTF